MPATENLFFATCHFLCIAIIETGFRTNQMLDVLSEKGREATRKARFVIYEYQVMYPELQIIETPNDQPADIDLLISKNDELRAIVEMKVRNSKFMKWEQVLQQKPFMLDKNKLIKGKKLALALRVPFYIWMFHQQSGQLISWHMTNHLGELVGRYTDLSRNGRGKKLQSVKSINDQTRQNDKLIGLQIKHGKIIASGIQIPT